MKALAISYKGMEDITALEIKEILGAESGCGIKESCVVFDVGSMEDLAKYCYKAQGVNRTLILLDEFKVSSVEDLDRVKNIDFSGFIKEGKSFAVRCSIVDNEDLNAREMERATGDEIDGKVDLKNPDITIFVYVYQDDCYIGVDFSGDVSKRDYKIFPARGDLKGTIAYVLVRLSNYTYEKTFMNLNAKSGTIAIEAALFGSGLSPHHHNKQKFLFLKFLDIDLNKFDGDKKPVEVYAYDTEGYQEVIENNACVADVDIRLMQISADCAVKFFKGTAKIKGLEKERKIRHGKDVMKIRKLD